MYKIIILLVLSILNAQYLNQETGWEFIQSSAQSFYIFEQIQIDGNEAEGDGWAPSLTLESQCVENPNTCDVVGAFINNICVGWVYADNGGGTTLPIMGYDDTNSETQSSTENYCNNGDIPEIKIYDSSNGTILSMTSGNSLPGWELNIAHVILNISFANNGIINSNSNWVYYQTSQQAFYLFEHILIDGVSAEGLDAIGAFNGDVCVGWINIDENGYTSVPVMGAEEDGLFSDYMNEGGIPSFKIYDYSEQLIYDLVPSQELESWVNNTYYILYGDSYAFIEQVIQEIILNSGWNMFSLNVNPVDINLYDIIEPIHNDLLLVLDETGSAIFPDATGTVWTDNIGAWQNTEGYLIKVSNSIALSISNDGIIELPITIPLSPGWNIISYPAQSLNDIENVLESLLVTQNLYTVFDQAGNVYVPDYVTGGNAVNSIGILQANQGYYVKVNNSDNLIVNEPSFILSNNEDIIADNTNRDEHFVPVWSGGFPFSPMTIIMDDALWDGTILQEGDEIGVFDGDMCVGAYVVPQGGFPSFTDAQIVTSKDDGSGNGFIEGHEVSFRVWKEIEEVDIDASINIFTNASGNSINPLFEALLVPRGQIEVKAPSEARNFNAIGGSNQITLSWNRPSTGDYQLYNYPDPGSSNAVTFNIASDAELALENLDATNYVDTGLDNNRDYNYTIEAISVVNISSSESDNALTKPGIPILSLDGGNNQIFLTWQDPEVTATDGTIDYQLYRQWNVGDATYTDDITNLDSNVNNQTYTDLQLLNTSPYSYRLRAHNTTGYSSWTSYQEAITDDPTGNVTIISNILDTTFQIILPPSNVNRLSWDNTNDAISYRIYERNLLLGTSIESEYTDPESIDRVLQTSTIYRYVLTGVDNNGNESSPSELIEVTTLPEYTPESPNNLILNSGQNNISLNWDPVLGYGDPIGGAAALYNIYRFNIEDFDLDSIDVDDIIGSVSGVNNTSYTNSNLDDNMYYCYGVSGVNSENAEGELSQVLCDITQDQLATSIPSNLNASGGNQQVSLSWSHSTGSPTINYQVYRSGNGFNNEFVINTVNTSYTDTGLSKNTEYTYYIVAWNELGPSSPSISVSTSTNEQSNLLAAEVPEDLAAELDANARASNYIDGYAQLTWDAKEYVEHPFNLAYSGNPYSPHTIVIQSVVFEETNLQIEEGDVIAVFDNQLCVGLGTWPLPGGQMSAAKNDGSGNGFTEGNQAYFRIWDSSTGHVITGIETPSFTFAGLGLSYMDIAAEKDLYNIYRNGEELTFSYDGESYQDNTLESGMDYLYVVSAKNNLGSWTESNPSESSNVDTYAYNHNAPVLENPGVQVIDEDESLTLTLSASDADGDVITYFAEPVNSESPVVCNINGNQLTLIPAPNHNGNYEIEVTAFDDTHYYENNTLFDSQTFSLFVNIVNDPPVLLNTLNDIQILEGEFQDSLFIDLANVFVDVDEDIMEQDLIVYEILSDNIQSVATEVLHDSLLITLLSAGETNIYITASDSFGESIADTLYINIDDVLEADDHIWPQAYKLSNAYPNPFNPITNFNIEIPNYSNVSIKVVDILGRDITQIYKGMLSKGKYTMSWNAQNYPSGIYFINFITNNVRITNKVLLIK